MRKWEKEHVSNETVEETEREHARKWIDQESSGESMEVWDMADPELDAEFVDKLIELASKWCTSTEQECIKLSIVRSITIYSWVRRCNSILEVARHT